MTITVENSLSGPAGAIPSASSLSSTARAGTVGIAAPERAQYSATETVHGLTTLEISTGHHRANSTPRLEVALPATPWHLRWYTRLPDMQVEGHGTNETRWLAGLGDYGLVAAESSGGTILLYLQPHGLASTRHTYDVASGSWPTLAQIHRVEVAYDGTDVIVSLYAEHGETALVTLTWQGFTLNATTAEITAYRYRYGVLLQQGDSGSAVEARQGQMITLGYLSPGDDDGIYGPGTASAVSAFQVDFGLVPVDGEIGPETGAAMDLAVQETEGTATPPPTYVSHLAVGTAAIGAASAPGGEAVASLAALAEASGQKAATGNAVASLGALAGEDGGRGGNAIASLGASGTVDGTKASYGQALAALGTTTMVNGVKHAYGTAVAQLGVVATATGTKHSSGQAVADLALSTLATQLIEPVPPVQAVARIVNQPEGQARASGRPAGAVHPIGRIDGTARRR